MEDTNNKIPNCLMKLDNELTERYAQWWNNLTKEELLDFIAHVPSITADAIRQIFANTNVSVASTLTFNANDRSAISDFVGVQSTGHHRGTE